MKTTVVLQTELVEEIRRVAQLPVETAGVLLASVVFAEADEVRILAREMVWLKAGAYDAQDKYGLRINSQGYIRPLAKAESIGATPIWVHTHPVGSAPVPSDHDVQVDQSIADVFRIRSGSSMYGALIFSVQASGLSFSGHLESEGRVFEIDRLWMVGNRFGLFSAWGRSQPLSEEQFDRNICAFGGGVQQMLRQMHVGVVGNGGTGSAVAEQLTRLGVQALTLVDPDRLSLSNVTRVYGSTPADIGRPKSEVLGDHLTRVDPQVDVRIVNSSLNRLETAKALRSCDIVFGCTDDNAGRLILSRMPTYLMLPVIDCGVLLTSKGDGAIQGIDGRVTTVVPASACLVCRDRIDLQRASAEFMTTEERTKREDEGYAPALGPREPAVVTFTTMVASMAVSEMLERLIGFGPEPRPSEVLLRLHDREISTNLAFSRAKHYCDPAAGKLGFGDADPFLGLTWAS